MSGYTADVIHKQGLLARNVPFILEPVSPGNYCGKCVNRCRLSEETLPFPGTEAP